MAIPLLWAAQVLLFAAGWAGPWRDPAILHTNGRVPRPIRMAVSALLVVAAVLIWRRGPAPLYSGPICGGMAASFLGDLIMARLLPLPNRLIGGMGAFAVAHALYITGYGYTASAAGASLVNPGLVLGLVVYVGGGAIGWWSAVRTPARGAVINLAALLYGGWIGIMAACAAAMAWVLGGHWWVAALGGLSFVISDFLIGVTEIRGRALAYANDWVWLTYVAGQMGIIYAAWL